jgi:putative transposase
MIKKEQDNFPVKELCTTLGVSRSGFYAWRERQIKPDAAVIPVKEIFWQHSRRYGSRRIVAELKAQGFSTGRRHVRRILRQEKLRAIQPKSFVPRTTNSNHGRRMSENLLGKMNILRPRQVLVSDITYVPLAGGKWAYLATWLDLYSRRILGWKIAESMTADLVIGALQQAKMREQLPRGLVLHSDRGGQYVDAEFRQLLAKNGWQQSMSRAGETYDNAHAESLWSRYKAELLEGGSFRDFNEAELETFQYIEGYYNRTRRHSALGYLSPEEFERAYFQRTKEGKPSLLTLNERDYS